MRKLYRFHWDCGRMGDVTGIFVEDEAVIEKAIGREVSFGEILGKHSDVNGTLDVKDITMICEDQPFIRTFEDLRCQSGYNPINYIYDCEEDA